MWGDDNELVAGGMLRRLREAPPCNDEGAAVQAQAEEEKAVLEEEEEGEGDEDAYNEVERPREYSTDEQIYIDGPDYRKYIHASRSKASMEDELTKMGAEKLEDLFVRPSTTVRNNKALDDMQPKWDELLEGNGRRVGGLGADLLALQMMVLLVASCLSYEEGRGCDVMKIWSIWAPLACFVYCERWKHGACASLVAAE